uniref:Uncharacterized protein n=1 Tax=Molossus molossus TaxID=27622 RepID=A0A7J8HFJ3_MOLMO|nr:hypothetical protein HJG59_001826 [Molossus molossus]
MAQDFRKPDDCGSRSTIHKSQVLDYVPWQRSKQKLKQSTVLPVLHTSGHKKSKTESRNSNQPGYSKPTMSTSWLRNPRELHKGNLDSGKTKFRLMRTIINILGYSNKKKLQKMTCELQDWKEKEESKMSYLKQQVEQLNAKIKKIQGEVNFLSTYMDHEYPVKSVQIASLERQLQQVKNNRQDELDDFNEMRKMVLESLSNQIRMKRAKLLSSLVAKTQQPRQEVLLQKSWENQIMAKCTDKFREFVDQYEEEIPTLRAEVEQLQVQIQEPREVVFADVLLQRPKCTPDMDVTLNIPVEELLPF